MAQYEMEPHVLENPAVSIVHVLALQNPGHRSETGSRAHKTVGVDDVVEQEVGGPAHQVAC